MNEIIENNFRVSVVLNNNEKKNIRNNKLYLADETKYSLQLTNNNTMIVDAYIKINGRKMGTFRIVPKEKILIKNSVNSKNQFKFVQNMKKHFQKNYKNKELGIIEIVFRSGVIYPKEKDFCVKKKSYRSENLPIYIEYMNPFVFNNNNVSRARDGPVHTLGIRID